MERLVYLCPFFPRLELPMFIQGGQQMDKHKVIEAYRRGLITLQECGQILGAEKTQLDDLLRVDHSRQPLGSNPFLMVDPF